MTRPGSAANSRALHRGAAAAASASERLAAFAAELRFADLPAAVIDKAKLHLLDLVGVALAGATMDFGAAARQAVAGLNPAGGCTVLGIANRCSAPWAALLNGTFAHGLDFDDTHCESVVHVSTSVVPAALASCEEAAGADGRALLLGVALGMEANVRIGLVARGGFHDRGFHPTGICGTYASALVAGKALGLGAAELADALGLAGSQAAGSLEFLTDGSWAKRIHGGWAAHGGLVAARLAAAGFSGPRGTFDGRFGLYRSHLGPDGWDLAALTAELGSRWRMLETALKPYPCCHYNHAFIDAAAALRAAHAVRPADIVRVECLIAAAGVPIVCEPAATKQAPQTDYDAKFSLPYAVAAMLVRGHVDVDDFTPAAIRDPAVLAVAARVDYRDDPQSDFPRCFPGRLRLHLRDGRVLAHDEPVNRGSAERPLSRAEVYDKFTRNAGRALPAQKVSAIVDTIESLDAAADLGAFTAALRP